MYVNSCNDLSHHGITFKVLEKTTCILPNQDFEYSKSPPSKNVYITYKKLQHAFEVVILLFQHKLTGDIRN